MKPVYALGWRAMRMVARWYFRCRVLHPERVPLCGPVILAANHASYIDPPLIGAALRRELHYLARASLFRHRFSAALLRALNCVPVEREGGGAAGLRAILDRLHAGSGILLFPEGTRTFDGRRQRALAGIGLVVIKSTCPVVPVRVFGSYEAFGRHVRVPRPWRLAVKFGQPMHFAAERAEAEHVSKARLKAVYQQVADGLMGAVAKLQPCAELDRFPASR